MRTALLICMIFAFPVAFVAQAARPVSSDQVNTVLTVMSKTAAVLGSAVGCRIIAEGDALAVLQLNVARAKQIGIDPTAADLNAMDREYARQKLEATEAGGCDGWLEHPEIAQQVRRTVAAALANESKMPSTGSGEKGL